MTDLEYALLRFIQANDHPHWTDVLNGFDPKDTQQIQSVLRTMLNVLIKTTDKVSKPPLCRLQLTDDGTLALRAERERRVREALLLESAEKDASRHSDELRSQRRHDWRVALAGAAVGAILGVAGALLTQYLSSLLF